ncbi:hypothetical protein [Bradyrhizobium sp. OK095]|uniref:hypothetical protein n=1 Tax=Bradyrhizobium sp. OK095 TaxID=1882760 RepID=UPI001FCD18E9|nr:hypothetical protein [Bradyrhizobium sp. OK095]
MQPAIAQDAMVMDGKFVSDVRQREELELIKAFLGITDPGRRQRILELAEQLANEAASDAAELAFISTDASVGEAPGDVRGRTE